MRAAAPKGWECQLKTVFFNGHAKSAKKNLEIGKKNTSDKIIYNLRTGLAVIVVEKKLCKNLKFFFLFCCRTLKVECSAHYFIINFDLTQ